MANTEPKGGGVPADQIREKLKETVLKAHKQALETPVPEAPSTDKEPEPFGGGTLIGVIVNPTPADVQKLEGIDKYGFYNSRWYGCSLFQPFQRYCSQLAQSDDRIDRMVGRKHLGDRFMVPRDTTAPFSIAEQAIWEQTKVLAENLFDQGALPPLVFAKVRSAGPTGYQVVENCYVPSCGFRGGEVIDVFVQYMSSPENWLQASRVEMARLAKRIEAGETAPVPGYEEN